MAELIAIAKLRRDGGTQPRAMLDPSTVEVYADGVREGASFPPVVVFHDGTNHWLADGFHRTEAHAAAGETEIAADIRPGTQRDAILFACGANATHGLRRTTEDKRRAVILLLSDPEWSGWSDREIAGRAHVSHPLVAKLREITGNISVERTYVTKHGTISTMRVGDIGRSGPSRRAAICGAEAKLIKLAGRSCVYVLQAGGLTKIGWSQNLSSRIHALRGMNPDAVLLGVIPGAGLALERELQARFVEQCRDGEWFQLDQSQHSVIGQVASASGFSLVKAAELAAVDAAAIGKRAADMATLRSVPVEALHQLVSEQHRAKQERKKARREERVVGMAGKIAAANEQLTEMVASAKRYGLIIEDSEWPWESWSRETGMDRAEENHYPTSSIEEICARPIGELAARDCVLLLWATPPRLPAALKVMEARGFTYRTHAVWRKLLPGAMRGRGYWFHFTHELVLLGTRGDPPCPALGTQWDSVFEARRGANSVKPPTMHEWAERFFPGVPKLECNARTARPGWDVWGAEAPALPPGEPVFIGADFSSSPDLVVEVPALPLRGRAPQPIPFSASSPGEPTCNS